ncbi:MAG TPA: 50S ribosomal protein L13 [Candidatus Dormibacteraeota bacterium]|jgi:large subunit ribosomal protein L13|nr:50S ribosomal protein L13 [Candidatus Dormibacteraeota bacterium]
MPQPGKTYSAKPSEITPAWYIVDARGQTLGRLAANVAKVLRGKHKPIYTPHLNTGDHVIVVNVKGIRVTGKKPTDKFYTSYTGYPGGLRKRAYGDMVQRHPTYPFRHAVAGMLQHGTLGKEQLRRLKIYSGDAHPHTAQQPVNIKFNARGEIEVIGH